MRTFLYFLFLVGCMATPKQEVPPVTTSGGGVPYDMAHPTAVFPLPPQLVEISALTDVDSLTVACVQDEEAAVYFLSLKDGRILRRVPFSVPGDFEGLTRVDSFFFALRSDGLIHRLIIRDDHTVVQDTFRLDLPNHNIEGLGYDEPGRRVLVSPKDFIKGSSEVRDQRVIHAFDPKDATHTPSIALTLSVQKVMADATAMGIPVPMRTKENGASAPALKLRYSSVAVHPSTGHYYLLSAADRTLLIVDRNGRLVDLVNLDPELLPKPEGITFLADQDLLLSSEGKGRDPVLVRYAYRPQ